MEKKRSLTRYHRSKDDSPEHDEDQVMGGGEDFEKRLVASPLPLLSVAPLVSIICQLHS